MKTTKHILVTLITTILLGWTAPSHASLFSVGTTWNAYNDFYFSPTTGGWTGDSSPSALGAAWGYYAANVNSYGDFPSQIGSYFRPAGSGSPISGAVLYAYSNVNSLGAPGYGTTVWQYGGGPLPTYAGSLGDTLARMDNPNAWFPGAPGYNASGVPTMSNAIWMQAGMPGGPTGSTRDGIAPVLTWTAPQTGVFAFAGRYLAANQSGNGAAVAIVDSLGTALLARTVLNPNDGAYFSFTASYNAGDVVQFQTGADFKWGNAVGWQVTATATAIPEPSSGMLLAAGLGALGLIHLRRRR